MKVGVILPSVAANSTGQPTTYQETRRWARRAEAIGFDSIWINDHLLFREPGKPRPVSGWAYPDQLGVWEGWTWMAALAEATVRVEIGSWVICTGFRSPALLAKMAVALDEVSAGRLILGVGAGWHDPEHSAFGFPVDHKVGQFEEAMAVTAPLLRTGQVDFHGTYYDVPDCSLDPRGPRPAGPPILIGADGPRMLRLTARFADLWNAHYLGDPGLLAAQRARLDAACEVEGRDPATVETTVGEFIVFDDLAPAPGPGIRHIDGSHAAIVELIGRYEEMGVGHLMLQCINPGFERALERLGEALAEARRGSSTVGADLATEQR
jgi:alkanesulfonate monooxygenase SsuD/methylene tetrahydromethanopterin reductase-like flavin-dependent oxidoreductase (luciferase family)